MLVMPFRETMPLSNWPRDFAAVMTASSVDEKYANKHSCRVTKHLSHANWLL